MLRLVILAVLATPVSWGQITDLICTDDGRQLYFTSPLLLSGTNATAYPELRLYRVTAEGVSLFSERGERAVPGRFGTGDGITSPQISGGGDLVGFTARTVCKDKQNPCMEVAAQAEVHGHIESIVGEGYIQLSRNGQWALLTTEPSPENPPYSTLVDLTTDEHTAVPRAASDTFSLASDGSVLAQNDGGFLLWRAGQVATLTLPSFARAVAVSDNARVIVYTQEMHLDSGYGIGMFARDLQTGKDATVFSPGLLQSPALMGISNDGRWILYRVLDGRFEGQCYLLNTITGDRSVLPLESGELATVGALTGFATHAFLATTSGRILRFPITAGVAAAAETLVAKLPYANFPPSVVPGSLTRIPIDPSIPFEQIENHVFLNDNKVSVLGKTDKELIVQIPWEQDTGAARFRMDLPS